MLEKFAATDTHQRHFLQSLLLRLEEMSPNSPEIEKVRKALAGVKLDLERAYRGPTLVSTSDQSDPSGTAGSYRRRR